MTSPADDDKPHFFDKTRNIKRVLWVFYALCAALALVDCVHHRHVIHPWESLWGFYGVYGFVACVALVLIAKEMRKLLMRDEGYYDDASAKREREGAEEE